MQRMLTLLFLLGAPIVLANNAEATESWCAQVKRTADGFVALRELPSETSKMLAKLKPGEIIEITSGSGRHGLNTLDYGESEEWLLVEMVPRLGLWPGHGIDDGANAVGWVHPSLVTSLDDDKCP
jgi:hypothetical protein